MKRGHRLISGMLSLAMVCSLCTAGAAMPAAAAAAPAVQRVETQTGSIGLTIRFDLPQTAQAAAARNICLRVSGGGKTALLSLPEGNLAENTLGAGARVLVKNTDGVELTSEKLVGYYEAELSGLPAGVEYEVSVTGRGYLPFSQRVTLSGWSRHIIVGTGDGTFSLGDLNGDGAVDEKDLSAMDGQLGKTAGLADYDLNGDGRVDVTDLVYVNHNCGIEGTAKVLEGAALVSADVDTAGLTLSGGTAADLFREEGTVTLTPAAGGEVALPVELTQPVDMSEIRITCPDGAGAVQSGSAELVLADGSTRTVPFDTSLPEGVHAIGRAADRRVVTIDLGARVAVKKVTIRVTACAGQAGYAAVTQIEFLKDIVPENPKNDADQVKGLTPAPADGQVTLTWNSVRNVTGYRVEYGASADALRQTAAVNVNRAVISGLDNFKTYYFRVTAVNGSWSGTPSQVVSAEPRPGKVPGAPSNIRVTGSDEALRLSWGSTKDASYYQVFYRTAGSSAFQQFGGNFTATSAVITGLTNGTAYEVAVKAGNWKGVGPYSAVAAGTPNREELTMPELPQEDRIDNGMIQSVVMADAGNVDRNLCPKFTTADVYDNNAATYWVARNWSLDSHFTYTFKEPQDMNYAILVPYLGGNYKYALNTYTVTAKDGSGNVLLSQTLYSARAMDGEKNYLVLPFAPVKGVKELTISLNEREGNGCRVSISEMAFYRSDSLAEDIAALFADGSFTALKAGVTGEQVSALSQRLEARQDFYLDLARLRDELALAQALLAQEGDALGVVRDGVQSRSGGKDGAYGQSASDLQPLGVTARAGATVAVYAQIPEGEAVYVVPTQFFGESGIWRGSPVRLVSGRNYITVPKIGSLTDERGGPLYLTYGGDRPQDIRIQVRGDANVFPMPVLELSGWYDMSEAARRDAIRAYAAQLQTYVAGLGGSAKLTTDVRNATEIATPSVLLSIPADRALAGLRGAGATLDEMTETLYQDVLAWEEELFVANKVQGILDSAQTLEGYEYPMTTRQNIRYMRMFAGAFMYAAGNHVGVGYGSTSGLMSGRPSACAGEGRANGLFGWGIAHEIGHNMDKLGKAEITNNIYALAIQAWDGGSMAWPTRLTISNIWPAIYDKTSLGRPGTASSVFVQLGMYWQLHLAYDQGNNPLAFYNKFFRAWKAGEYKAGFTYDERVALVAAKTAGKNLTEFFTRWGLVLGEDARNELKRYGDEPRAIWYLNDDAYAYRLNGGGAFAGQTAVSAQVEDSRVTLTVSGGSDAVLGYEIRRDGKAVGFTTTGSYTDELGVANNLAYSYTAVPVDKLGGMGAESAPVQARVAYDKAVDPASYDLSRDGTTVTIVMKEGKRPVTGVKITGSGLSGEYAVRLKADASAAEWTQAKRGTLSGEAMVGYFTKPGAGPEDARIWTYDAAVLELTGIPEGAGVALLDDPGDRVDFYEDAVAGVLKFDYKYGDGADQVIPAGTLVILGAYRGDPVYNTLEVEARYDTTLEAAEAGTDSGARPMNGDAYLFAEVPADGAVSDISNGFWLFVPDWEAEEAFFKALMEELAGAPESAGEGAGQPDEGEAEEVLHSPMEIRVVFYRTDDPENDASRRETSSTTWVSFPERATMPEIELKGAN